VLTHEYHYIYYDKYAAARGFTINTFKMIDMGKKFIFDIDDCIRQYKKTKPKVILITSPNNPTGNSLATPDLEKLLRSISKKTLVIIDGAYAGLGENNEDIIAQRLVTSYENLIITRTFSKLYALAGLRIAYGLCGREAQKLMGYQPYYLGFSRILEETALAALGATGYYKKLRERIVTDRAHFITAINNLKHFTAYPSDATFVLIKPDVTIRELFKQAVQTAPFNLVRPISETHFRVSLDPQKYTKIFIKLLAKIDLQV
jgi:histidinol-phosphate aminotransferase